jgi:hypothetical protein
VALGHIFMFGRLAAIGAGLHIAALFLEHETKIGTVATVVSVVIPVALYVGVVGLSWSGIRHLAAGLQRIQG